MKDIESFLLLVLFILISGWFYRRRLKSKHKKELEERAREREAMRQKLLSLYKSKLGSIESANREFAKYLEANTGYFTNYQLTTWKSQQAVLFNELKGKPFERIGLAENEARAIKEFNNYFSNAERLRNNFNQTFIGSELKTYDSFFDNIEGRKLDIQQRTAVITDEDNNIVIAGAGSGKTTTIVGKVSYVIDRYKACPEEILLISFTNKSATTLADRINIKGIEAKTFHKFGKDIIVEVEGRQPSVFDEAQFKSLLKKHFTELIRDPRYLQKVTKYFTNFLKPEKSQFEFNSQGEYIQYIKDKNFKSYKQKKIVTSGKATYKMEVVKSIEECKIANFLLFNGVNYEYELPYEHETANETFKQYKPDFTVIQKGKKVYIEHFGISRSGDVPEWFKSDGIRSASEKYRSDMEWKRSTHKRYGTTLLESYSYEMSEGSLFNNLSKKLEDAGIILAPKSPQEIWEIINNAAKEEVQNFITLFGTFITLMKSNNYSIEDVIGKNKQTTDKFIRERNKLFIDLIAPILERYEDHLTERSEIDFSDMINRASVYVASGKYKRKFRYVVIDEFQDISIGRYQLVKAIKERNPSCKLFCVGDDWQSIYRFSGSDIALFKEFENYFGFTVKSKIETTYRFYDPLIKLSSDFILKNPNQAAKQLKGAFDSKTTDYQIHYSVTDNEDDTPALTNIFNEILKTEGDIERKEILILGRYSFDINRIKNENAVFRIDTTNDTISYNVKTVTGEVKKLTAQFMTVHKAKGLEGDIVIVLNCNSGRYGFPSEMSDDPVLNLLLSQADQFENGEERRLFYVAMTRAKEKIFFIANSSYKSKFISELEIESGQSPNKKCPTCKTADMVFRKSGKAKNGNTYKFFGCTNHLYGCDHTVTEWLNNKEQTEEDQ